MTEVIRCNKGHYYDCMAFKECPHCASGYLDHGTTMEYRTRVSSLAQQYIEWYRNDRAKSIPTDKPTEISDTVNNKNISHIDADTRCYLATGWVVCIGGPDIGYSYSLYYGYNTVGCGSKNQICLSEDSNASYDTHCSIIYEDRKNHFYLMPEHEQPVYLNGTLQSGPVLLDTGDQIGIGKDRFEFIAFCKGDRKWNRKEMKEGRHSHGI